MELENKAWRSKKGNSKQSIALKNEDTAHEKRGCGADRPWRFVNKKRKKQTMGLYKHIAQGTNHGALEHGAL